MIRHMAGAPAASHFSILHIGKFYPPHAGGMETHLRDLATRQAQTAKVKVIVSNSGWRSDQSVTEGVTVMRVGRVAAVSSMPVCPGLPAAIARSPANLVHIHTPNPGAALSFLMSRHPAKLIITHHADTMGRRFLRKASDPIVFRLMERASRICVTSRRYLESSPELADFRGKCSIVPLGIDPQFAAAADPETLGKLRVQFPEGFILAVGRLVPYKGFDILIRAMKRLQMKLLLIGIGPMRDDLLRLATSEGVGDKVIMPGRVDDTRPYFAAASVFVLPSVTRAEAFGLVQLEAMAAGVPVVNCDIDSGVPEVSVNGETGITVPPGDPAALRDAIQSLLDERALRERLGTEAKIRVNAEYSADLMCLRTMRIYEEVLQNS